MFGRRIEEEFVNTAETQERGGDRGTTFLLLLTAALVGGFLWWAHTNKIEQVTRGNGTVIPSQKVQVVQSLEGGVVRSILLREGDLIEQGAVLMQIDDTSVAAELGELEERKNALLAEKLRLEAEAKLQEVLEYPDELAAKSPLATAVELEVFQSRRTQLDSELEILGDKIRQRRSELAELEALQSKRRQVIAPLAEEIELVSKMTESGTIPRIELLRLNSQMAELQGDLTVGEAAKVRVESSLAQSENELDAAVSAYVLTARQRLARLQVELAVVQEELRAASERVTRTQLRSPVRGTINALSVNSIGAVVRPGQEVAEIVPADDGLLIEVKLRPADVAFVTPGAEASVKITAYDYLIYGSLPGIVERIGADTVTDAEGNEFFRAVIRTEQNILGPADQPLPISAGMVASVDIRTGQRTVLEILLKPLRRAQNEALREG
ncbi:HlyD family type I secretion periplasmic adaptor subunit [Primorskyibacter sp. S87]|uniref:HlyD family type I secretion periplasmic adaptor subunit n=1 Tax=Primorskyibacter sp. S87 TaxID=3415126 RepID=UPI003C799396